jgi:predicted DNA repair protein MutK
MSQVGQMMPMDLMGGSQNNTLLWVIIGLLTIIILYLWYNGREHVLTEYIPDKPGHHIIETDKIEVAMKLLSSNERMVVEALIGNDGEMLQKDLHYDLDLSRVQAHRIVQTLTQRDIVTAEDHYNTKKVRLAEWLMS